MRAYIKSCRLFIVSTLVAVGVFSMTGCLEDSVDFPEEDPTDDSYLSFDLTAHPENTLMAVAYVDLSPEASVYIEYSADAVPVRQTALSATNTHHEITVIGMRAHTTYTMTARVEFPDGATASSDPVAFTTGRLPDDNIPEVELTASTENSAGGVTFFGTTDRDPQSGTHRYWGVDEEGQIVWYLHGDYTIAEAPVIRALEPGVLQILLHDSIQTITASGETIAEYYLSQFHHDAIVLANGNTLALDAETRENGEGELIVADLIVERNTAGQTLWEWATFDQLDTTRFPGALSTAEDRSGALDWSHANALFYLDEEDALLLSLRSQSWVVKIDLQSSEILWILGNASETDPAYAYNDRFLTLTEGTWMSGQHASMLTENGEILLFDNRNESGGSELMSRAVKFSIDETTMTARQTWEAIAPKYARALGDVDELPDGNVLICASGAGTDSYIVESSPDASAQTVWAIRLENRPYRAERMRWGSFLATAQEDDYNED